MYKLYFAVLFLGFCFGQEVTYRVPPITRPCPSLDFNCVRKYIVRNTGCTPQYGPLGELYVPGELVLPIPHANLTVTWLDPYIRGLGDVRILEFYVNRDTKKVVMEVLFDQISMFSSTALVKYYFKGSEPLILNDYLRIVYNSVSITVTVPYDSLNGVRWAEIDVYTYFENPSFWINGGPGLVNSDPQVKAAHYELLGSVENLNLSVKEASVVKGPYFFELFFNNLICTF